MDEWIKDHPDLRQKPDISLVKRCPKCAALNLTFDPDLGKLKCGSCGFEIDMQV